MDEVRLNRLTMGSVFKIGYFGSIGLILPLCLIFGLLALGGADTVTVNERYVHGIGGLVAAIVMGLLFPLFFAVLLALGSLPLRLMRDWVPKLKLRGG